jgi:hypothetical protein
MDSEKLTVRKSEWTADWYVIETEDGRDVNEASVEGSLADMRDLATAIRARTSRGCGRRVGVIVSGTRCAFYSPRNSGDGELGWFDLANADALAREIDAVEVPQ